MVSPARRPSAVTAPTHESGGLPPVSEGATQHGTAAGALPAPVPPSADLPTLSDAGTEQVVRESAAPPSARAQDVPIREPRQEAVATTAAEVVDSTDVSVAPGRPTDSGAAGPGRTLTNVHPAEGLGTDGVVYSPAFASTGTALYFQREKGRGSALMRADTDPAGRAQRVAPVVDDGANNFHVRPSPDEQWIAFDSDRDRTRGVYVADANGRDARRVSGPGYAAVPSWSPDGRSLVFVRAEPSHPHVWNLWQVTLASGQLRRLTSYKVGQPWGASWFPDGRRIAYSHETALVGTRHRHRAPAGIPESSRRPPRSHAGSVAIRRRDHLSGVSRRRLAAEPVDGSHAPRPGRRLGRGIRLVAGWSHSRVSQPAIGSLGTVARVGRHGSELAQGRGGWPARPSRAPTTNRSAGPSTTSPARGPTPIAFPLHVQNTSASGSRRPQRPRHAVISCAPPSDSGTSLTAD